MKSQTSGTAGRTKDRKAIWVFTPSRTDPQDLEFILVQRHQLLQDAVERVRESALTDHKHHLLFVGPRGCGKTHLISLVVHRLSQDDELTDRLRIAWLNEDETCTTLLELLVKIHSALEKRYPAEYREEMIGAMYDMKPDAALEFVSRHLLASMGSRTLLVVTENLDAIFEGLGDAGQKRLRSFIQEHPQLSIVATAQRLVEDLSDRTSPFFGFFQTEHLKPLNVEQATELLQNIARLQDKVGVVEFLATNRGRSRVRATHHLSGGNHRIYIVLSQFITRDTVDALLEPFMKMVDELTPYYQERIRWLPPMQRKIIEYLCVCEGTVPVKEIAKRLFATPQTVSSQLQDLREKGYVEAHQRGRESFYGISEPLMRICVEVKDNQRVQPLRLLVDFLRVWYEDHELKNRLGQMEPTSTACAYVKSAIERNGAEGNLRKQILLEDFRSSISEKVPAAIRDGMIQELKNSPEGLMCALQNMSEGTPDEAISCLDKALAEETTTVGRVSILLLRAALHLSLGEQAKEIADYTEVIHMPEASAHQVALALFNRGFCHSQAGDVAREIADYTAVVDLLGAPVDIVARALFNRGISHNQAGDVPRSLADYAAVINLPEAPVELVARALFNRGFTYYQNGRMKESQVDFESLIQLPAAPLNKVVDAHGVLSELHFNEGRWREGFQSLAVSLECGEKVQPVYRANAVGLVGIVFSAGLSAEGRRDKVTSLLRAYGAHEALAVLGGALVLHISRVFRSGPPFPSTDNLEGWASAWEQAAQSAPDFRLSVRLLRTGIDFVKSGGTDPGILLTLTSPERAILEQALGLAKKDPPNMV